MRTFLKKQVAFKKNKILQRLSKYRDIYIYINKDKKINKLESLKKKK